jgi:hypothetical protein
LLLHASKTTPKSPRGDFKFFDFSSSSISDIYTLVIKPPLGGLGVLHSYLNASTGFLVAECQQNHP